MPKLAEKAECCGCAACVNICKKNVIWMEEDVTGFMYPQVDTVNCIECKQCESVCPALCKIEVPCDMKPKAYIGQCKNNDIRKESTSGGIFSCIAKWVIDRNGVVFGAALMEGFHVQHISVTSEAELWRFRNSKYVQSEIGYTYRECKEYLNQGKYVCFSGTPCQIHGLRTYLKIQYERLITVDIVCHSVPSPLVFKKYLELQKAKYPRMDKIVFRDKKWGYSYSTMAIYEKEKCVYRQGSETDLWFRSFLPGLCDRENCYSCQFQEWPRKSDITIWDCFNVAKIEKSFDDNLGTTSIMVWSEMGEKIIEDIQITDRVIEISSDVFVDKINREQDRKLVVDRTEMYNDVVNMSAENFFAKYRPTTFKVKLKQILKRTLYITGLYNWVKRRI